MTPANKLLHTTAIGLAAAGLVLTVWSHVELTQTINRLRPPIDQSANDAGLAASHSKNAQVLLDQIHNELVADRKLAREQAEDARRRRQYLEQQMKEVRQLLAQQKGESQKAENNGSEQSSAPLRRPTRSPSRPPIPQTKVAVITGARSLTRGNLEKNRMVGARG